MRTESQEEGTRSEQQPQSFGEINFGQAQLGDRRRTSRLVRVADALTRHPGGSLPEKLRCSGELDGLYHLMKGKTVTHETVLAAHLALTLQKIAVHNERVLVIHDTTELDFTTHKSLDDAGQIGNGSRRGWLCHNSLAVCPTQREVLGLTGQILHRRATVRKKEGSKARREREDRESRLWVDGTQTLPPDQKIIDVCDRGADTFEFLEHELHSGRTFLVRSCYNRGVFIDHSPAADRSSLHDFARTLPSLGQWTLSVPAARLEKRPKKTGPIIIVNRKKREAVLHVASAPVQIIPPSEKRGDHGNAPLPLWIVRVWEPDPPEGVEPLEWFLLTNHPAESFHEAYEVVSWYECRWIIEEYHKAQKTGCRIQSPQFKFSDRLHPMVALLSVVALSLLNLREQSRREDSKTRPATDIVSSDYVVQLSAWRGGKIRSDWTIHDFFMALARLGGHLNRQHDHHPGWIVLWRGWTQLQLMIEGQAAMKKARRCA
jgi:hypothetical protein